MSRILIEGRFHEHLVPVVIGWDRPLQHCFLQFELDDDKAEDEVFEPLFEVSAETMFQPLTVDDVQEGLRRAGVSIPDAALAELRSHMDINAGNVIVRFAADGQRTAVV